MKILARIAPIFLGAALLSACGGQGQPASAPSQPAPQPTPAATQYTAPAVSPTVGPSTSTAASAAPASVLPAPAVRPPAPVELIIPAIKVDAQVEQVGQDPTGAMDVPKKWEDVGWYKLGFRPGETGRAVMAGHLDSTTDKAVFWDLHLLKPGDKVQVKQETGSTLTFQVTGSEAYAYNQAPLQKIFGPAAAATLNLITCNGTFDKASKNYDKRLVVYTKLVN